MSARISHLDDALERVSRLREQLLADVDAPHRAERIAVLFESEARVWSQLFDLARTRLVWRAALAAEARARAEAHIWWRRAVAETAPDVIARFAVAERPQPSDARLAV